MMSRVFRGGVSTSEQIRYGMAPLAGSRRGHSIVGENFFRCFMSTKKTLTRDIC